MTKERLFEYVRAFVAAHPGESGELLRVVADGLKDYETAQKEERDGLARQALLCMMSLTDNRYPFPPRMGGIPTLIDPAFHQFPKGPVGHAPCELDFWTHQFLVAARRDGVDRGWLRDIKGPEFEAWWDAIVVPALAAGGGERVELTGEP